MSDSQPITDEPIASTPDPSLTDPSLTDPPVRPGRGWARDVVLYLTGQSLSLFGSAVVGYAIIWYVTLKTGSSGQYALLVIMSSLALAVTIIPGGILADRHWRKALMIGADAAVAVVTAILAILMLNGFESLGLIAVMLALRGLGGGIQMPSVSAALPQIAPTDRLLRVNAINQALQAVIQVAAPGLAAVLLVYWPLGWILMVDVTTAALGITITVFIRIPRLERDPAAPAPEGLGGYIAHVGQAVGYALRIPGLRRGFWVAVLLLTVVVPFSEMTPVFVVRLYGSQQWMLAAVEIAWSAGMVVGGLAMAAWGGWRNRMTMFMLAAIVLAGATAAMGFMPTLWWFVAIMVVGGMALPMMNTPLTTAIQELIPEAMMGRVLSFMTLANAVCAPLGLAILGPLGDHWPIAWMALVCGLIGLVVLLGLVGRGGPGSKLYAEGAQQP